MVVTSHQRNDFNGREKVVTMDEKTLREYLFRETEIVQDIISRMATNQFYAKGWSITLVVASILFKGDTYSHCVVALLPWSIFWVYDAYFLRLERLYRKHYGWLIDNRLNNDEFLLDMDRKRIEDKLKKEMGQKFPCEVPSIVQIMLSNRTILAFHGLLLVIIIACATVVDYLISTGRLI